MKRPVIGVLPLYDPEQDSYWMLPGYLRGVEEAGGIPVILPPRAKAADLSGLLDRVDGLLFTGGQDVDPALYGQAPTERCGRPCPERDRLESALLPLALERDLPVLGICRGIQLFNAVLGGSLWQDLPTERPGDIAHRMEPPYDRVGHWVTLTPDTPLARLLGTARLGVNTHHHQAIRELAPALREMARSEDGLVEAVYAPDKRFFWAIQWHPEMSLDNSPASPKIFSAFVAACASPLPASDGDTERLGFYGSETARFRAETGLPGIHTPRDLYRALQHCWSAETCASRMRSHWSPENPTLGQCSITAFLAQDLFGGRVCGVPLENGFYHCYNVVDGCVFDLTSEQFGGETLHYENNPEQYRAHHFSIPEKRDRYALLWTALLRKVKLGE